MTGARAAKEGASNPQLRRVYDLQPACVRLDSTAASGHWTVTEDGLFQFGHRTDHRPDLPQVKVMLAARDGYAGGDGRGARTAGR